MTAFSASGNEQCFRDWLSERGFSENPFEPDGWDDAALRALVNQRLATCSGGRITCWEELCLAASEEDTLAPLLAAAQGSPQRLLRLCDDLLRRIAAQGKTSVTAAEVAATLSDVTPAPPHEGLYVDLASGHVWIDRRLVLPPLTGQEFMLLRLLYVSAPEIVSCETLIRSLWPDDRAVVGDEQSLRKLVSRLRRRLEPTHSGGDWRFIRCKRGRGYWLNLES